jgi:CubicO group peptidase (beta-lactamase class C family)
MPLAVTLSRLADTAGYGPDHPLVIAVGRHGRRPAHLSRGCFPSGASGVIACAVDPDRGGPTTTTLVYMASLAKQVTAACAALLVHDGRLDVETTVAAWLPDLPDWSHTVLIRHLLHHTSGLPLEGDRTVEAPPGTRYSYSNVGYVLLAEIVRAAGGEPLPDLAHRRIFAPLDMTQTLFWYGPEPAPPGAAPLEKSQPPPLSIGDGGMWSTAADMLRWADALDHDRLAVSDVMQTPGRLDDGTPLDYAWGMGVRTYAGHRAFRHGGSYADVRTMLVRVPEKGLDLVILALADHGSRCVRLTDSVLETLLA